MRKPTTERTKRLRSTDLVAASVREEAVADLLGRKYGRAVVFGGRLSPSDAARRMDRVNKRVSYALSVLVVAALALAVFSYKRFRVDSRARTDASTNALMAPIHPAHAPPPARESSGRASSRETATALSTIVKPDVSEASSVSPAPSVPEENAAVQKEDSRRLQRHARRRAQRHERRRRGRSARRQQSQSEPPLVAPGGSPLR